VWVFIECLHCKELVEIQGERTEGAACPICGQSLPRVDPSETATTSAEQPREIGKFRLLQRVGAGSFGAVWKAADLELGRTVAVKLLHPTLVPGKAENARFYREARAAAQLRHPGIVTVHEVAELDGLPAIVSDFVEGVTLKELLAARRLECREAATLAAQVADALDYAHSLRIVHRDVKPGNIMVAYASGEGLTTPLAEGSAASLSPTNPSRGSTVTRQGPRALLLDFGLALREEGEATLTCEGQILGTPAYMSPEQASGESHRVDRRTDVYSLGVVLYEMLAGEVPFRGAQMALLRQILGDEPRRPRDVRGNIPRDLETVCLKALAKQRSARYGTAGEMAADLRRFLTGDPILARPVGAAEKLWRFCRRNPTVAALTAGIAALLVLCTAVSLYFAVHADNARRAEANARRAIEQALADSYTASGLQASEVGKPAESLIWFAAACQRSAGDAARERDNAVRFWSWARSLPFPVRAVRYGGQVKTLQIHPTGRYALVHHMTSGYGLWDLTNEQAEAFPDGAASAVAAAWTRDGTLLATGSAHGRVGIYRFPQGERVAQFEHPGAISVLAFDESGKRLAVASDRLRVWDCPRGAFVTPPYAHPASVAEVAFNQGGSQVATACVDGLCRVWPVPGEAGQTAPAFAPVRHLVREQRDPHPRPLPPVFVDRDRGLLTRCEGGKVAWISAATGAAIRTIEPGRPVGWMDASPDRQYFALTGFDHVQLYDSTEGKPVGKPISHSNFIYWVSFHPDGRSLLTASGDRTARLWSVPEGKPLSSPLQHQDEVMAAAFGPRGAHFVTAQMDGLLRVWKHEPLARRVRTGARESYVQISPAGTHAIAAGFNTRRSLVAPRVHDLVTGQPAGPPLDAGGGLVNNAAFAPDGRRVVLLASLAEHGKDWRPHTKLRTQAGQLHFFDWRDGRRPLEPLTVPTEPIGAAFAPNGKRLAVVCAGGEVLLVDAATGRTVRQASHGRTFAPGFMTRDYARFFPDGSRFVTWGPGFEARAWDAESGRSVFAISTGPGFTSDVHFSSDGKLLATASYDKMLRVCEAATGREMAAPLRHPDWVFTGRFSPDGRRVATACRDHMARVWDWSSGKLACPPMAHPDEVFDVSYAREGRFVLTACRDGTMRVWDAGLGKPMGPPLPVGGKCFRVAVTPDDAHVVVAGEMPHLLVYRLVDLVEPGPTPEGGLQGLAEVASGLTLHERGGVANLTTDEWFARWAVFRGNNPAYPPLAYSP
jgi:serine/threonine protein kinase/WD40 repeat protein